MFRFLCAAGLALLAGSIARSDPPRGVKTIQLLLHPAVPPAPTLRYQFLPELRDQKPGNAVPIYRKAVLTMKETFTALNDRQWYDNVEKWREMPLDQLPREQIHTFLRSFDATLREAAEGARHEYADWDLTDKLRKQGITTLLPDVQEMRNFAHLLAVRIRLAAAEGRIADAVHDLQTMLAMGRHLNQAPTLICGLVGMAVTNMALQQVDALIQAGTAPNLYWSLTDLPQPFIDLRTAFQGERLSVYGTFPGLPMTPLDPIQSLTAEQAERTNQMIVGLFFDESSQIRLPRVVLKFRVGLDMQKKHEKAKAALVEAGWPRATVEKLPHLHVALLHGLLDYERQMDDVTKWNSFPYWQAAPALLELESRRVKAKLPPGPDDPALPVLGVFLPGSSRLMYSRTRTERKIAALRCLEAIRMYAARHDGKLPARLDDVKDVPVPVDPFTGKPFEYTATGDKATLYAAAVAPPIPGREPNPQDALRYEIVLKK